MLEVECYINPKKLGLLLYMRYGISLAGIEDADDWVFSSSISETEVPEHLLDEIRRTGHAFQQVAEPE